MKWVAGLIKRQKLEQLLNNMTYIYERRHIRYVLRFCFFTLTLLFALSACSDSAQDVAVANEAKKTDTLPTEIIYDAELKYSERGYMKFILTSGEVHNFTDTKTMVFENGLHVDFFDTDKTVKTSLDADYGVNYENDKMMEARKNVVLVNYKTQETLKTDHLIWDQKKHIIKSYLPVTITTPNEVIHGSEGFESDEAFENWVIRKPSGNFNIDENE